MKKFIQYSILPAAIISVYLFSAGFSQRDAGEYSNEKSSSGSHHHSVKSVTDVKPVRETVEERKSASGVFREVNIFSYRENDNGSLTGGTDVKNFAKDVIHLKLDDTYLLQLLNDRHEEITFKIPLNENEWIMLDLVKVKVVSEDYKAGELSQTGRKDAVPSKGLFYRGVVRNNENAFASVSLFDDFVIAMIFTGEGNYILGSIKENNTYTDNYIFYNDRDLLKTDKFKCGVNDDDPQFSFSNNLFPTAETDNQYDNTAARRTVGVYFEADYRMYLDAGSDPGVLQNFIQGFFNSVAALYQNEYLSVEISDIGWWASPDPYMNLNSSVQILERFGFERQDNFNGDLAHLLSTRTENFGGVAWVRVLCVPYQPQSNAGRYAFSNIQTGYNNYPDFSFTVEVVSHEMGHNFGSSHTQRCIWPVFANGGIGAIDSCYYAEGNCFQQPRPAVGTIMSYCYIWNPNQGGGVDFTKGFGPLPGDTIRLRYNQASCFGPVINSSELPIAFNLLQNFPNPFNPGTNIKFALPEASVVNLTVYDIAGREIAQLVNGKFYDKGIYTVYFNSNLFKLSSGAYFYRINAHEPGGGREIFSEIKKMVLIK